MSLKPPTITAACAVLGLLGPACAPQPEGPPPPAEVRLSGVRVWHHAGETLAATAEAPSAVLDPEASAARLRDARLTLTGPDATLSAPLVRIELQARTARGEGGARVEGPGYVLTGAGFEADLEAETLAMAGPVHAEAEVAP